MSVVQYVAVDRCVQLHVCHLNSILDDIDTVCVLELEIATSIKLMLYTKHFKAIQTVALCRKLIKIKQSKTFCCQSGNVN